MAVTGVCCTGTRINAVPALYGYVGLYVSGLDPISTPLYQPGMFIELR
jgi:hypothetical protein